MFISVVGAALTAVAHPSRAHHNGGVSTVAPASSPDGVVTTWRHHQSLNWLALQLTHRLDRFADLARGVGRETTVDVPEVNLHTTTLQATLTVASRVSFALALPWVNDRAPALLG